MVEFTTATLAKYLQDFVRDASVPAVQDNDPAILSNPNIPSAGHKIRPPFSVKEPQADPKT